MKRSPTCSTRNFSGSTSMMLIASVNGESMVRGFEIVGDLVQLEANAK